ncbi:hypothetical protein EGW08_018291, partial [Elysia chlorotica]
APKSDTAASSTLQLSPSEASSEGDVHANSPTSSSSNSCFAYELDHDYENVASPCSSTASGPTYVRQPGFRHHAHEVTIPAGGSIAAGAPSSFFSSSPSSSSAANASLFSASLSPANHTPFSPCCLVEPLPMKLRALPQSFWQQPNVAHQVSPATLFPILPPLPNKDTEETLMGESRIIIVPLYGQTETLMGE